MRSICPTSVSAGWSTDARSDPRSAAANGLPPQHASRAPRNRARPTTPPTRVRRFRARPRGPSTGQRLRTHRRPPAPPGCEPRRRLSRRSRRRPACLRPRTLRPLRQRGANAHPRRPPRHRREPHPPTARIAKSSPGSASCAGQSQPTVPTPRRHRSRPPIRPGRCPFRWKALRGNGPPKKTKPPPPSRPARGTRTTPAWPPRN